MHLRSRWDRRSAARILTEDVMDENESLRLMCGWLALAVINLVLIAVAFVQFEY